MVSSQWSCGLLSLAMNIPFYKPSIGEDEIAEVVDTLRSGWLTTGPKVKQFEKEFALYLGHKHAVAEVVRYLGARPILADCRTEDFNLDIVDAERRIQEALRRGIEVKAIVSMHYGGQIGDVAGVAALARRHKLKIIEDAAHCCPAYYRDHKTTDHKTTDHKTTDHKTTDHKTTDHK